MPEGNQCRICKCWKPDVKWQEIGKLEYAYLLCNACYELNKSGLKTAAALGILPGQTWICEFDWEMGWRCAHPRDEDYLHSNHDGIAGYCHHHYLRDGEVPKPFELGGVWIFEPSPMSVHGECAICACSAWNVPCPESETAREARGLEHMKAGRL